MLGRSLLSSNNSLERKISSAIGDFQDKLFYSGILNLFCHRHQYLPMILLNRLKNLSSFLGFFQFCDQTLKVPSTQVVNVNNLAGSIFE